MYCSYTSFVILDSAWKLHYNVSDCSLSLFPLLDMIKGEKRPLSAFLETCLCYI